MSGGDAVTLDLLFARARTGQLPLEAVINSAEQLQHAHRPADAAALYRLWLEHTSSPAACVAHFNLGVLLAAAGDLDGVQQHYHEAWALNPRLHQARINAGLIAERQRKPAEAAQLWLDVAAAAAGAPDTLQFATIALNHLGRMEESRRQYALPEERLAHVGPRPGGPLRIGYLSGDLCTHAVGLLMPELLEAHDKSRVHVTAFDFSPEDGTSHRARLKAACDDVVDIRAVDDRTAALAIRDRHIDVLIDMHGLSSGARPGILALRPARSIGTYLGFIGTTALPWIDFVVADRFTLPESLAPFMTERPLYIDGSLIPLSHTPVPRTGLTRASVGLPDDAVVLACFNNIYKITPGVFACWLRILRRVPQAVLWLLDDNTWATSALRHHAESAGIGADRLKFAGRSTHAEYRERLTLVDLYIDTFPYNAGSTARDVLDAGVPMVTLAGQTMVSRMAGGLLHAAGFDQLITTSVEAYETRIAQLASQPDALEDLRRDLRTRAESWRAAPARWMRSFEDALLK